MITALAILAFFALYGVAYWLLLVFVGMIVEKEKELREYEESDGK